MIWIKGLLLFVAWFFAWLLALVVFIGLLFFGHTSADILLGNGNVNAWEGMVFIEVMYLAIGAWAGAMLRPGHRAIRWIGFFAFGAMLYLPARVILKFMVPGYYIFIPVSIIVFVFAFGTGHRRNKIRDVEYWEELTEAK